MAARGLDFLCPRSPVPWQGQPPQQRGCLPAAWPCCQEHTPGSVCRCSKKGPSPGWRPVWSLPTGLLQLIRAGAAYVWSAGPREALGPLALAMALTSACVAAGFLALPRQKEVLVWWQDPGQCGPNGCRSEDTGLPYLAAGLSLSTEGSPWAF